MRKYIWEIRWVILLIIANHLCANLLAQYLPYDLSVWVFRIGRFLAIFLCGWIVISKGVGGLMKAALGGAFLFFIDHVILKGGYFLIMHLYDPTILEQKGAVAFVGVIVSYIMYVWVAMGVALLGGIAARGHARLVRQGVSP